ncbi:hypothetical protein EK21DRAFT_101818 [Setomelanomma holmii]|uniref:Protein kinase domain-containing protein n=1 Tax=Setomelanomma holmii TaxID=210430 RepID=A0A9P4LKR8_9PLEO|nr:hypothetical protein EK21DRAFT_101818 [Setomelanomma holmii]
MSAELALAIPPTVDLCIKSIDKEGKELCSTLRHAGHQISERILRLDNSWLRFTYQLNFFQRVRHLMEDEHIEIYEQTLLIFQSKLDIVVKQLQGLVRSQPAANGFAPTNVYAPKRLKYGFKKEALDQAIEALEIWQQTADQSWFLLMKIADPSLDRALSTTRSTSASTFGAPATATIAIRSGSRYPNESDTHMASSTGLSLEADALKQMQISQIAYCNGMTIATRQSSNGQARVYILNPIVCEPTSKYQSIKKNTRDLGQRLQHDEPYTFGLLTCKGFISGTRPSDPSLTMVFRNPPGSHSPRSLRELLLSTAASTSTSKRLDIARDIAKAVGYVHTFGFMHKNIRPDTVLVFENANGTSSSSFLVGFDNFRHDEGWTVRRGDDAPEHNLYRHASRQGAMPRDDYDMQHDIYSLGVFMLEIGLRRSFVDYTSARGDRRLSSALSLTPSIIGAEVSPFLLENGKDHLLSMARKLLPGSMGDKYAAIVETCLTCLDPGNADFGDESEFEDEQGILVGSRYIEKVILRLNMVSM